MSCLGGMKMTKFEQFYQEKKYLGNVSPRTIEWHKQSLKWLGIEEPTEADCKAAVIKMREAGLKASTVNCRLRSINAYLHWLSGNSGECSPQCKHPKIAKLKEPKIVLSVFSKEDIKKFMAWKTKTLYQQRLQTLVLTLADVGARISEVLTLKWSAVDLDNLLVTLHGKGDKERIVPFSIEMRKHLFKLKKVSAHTHANSLVFATKDGNELSRRNALRDVKRLCADVGLKPNPRLLHSFRHSYATQFLRAGGNVFALQRCLGHSSLTTTRVYEHLLTEDLQKIHSQVSLLS
jgi:integrase/recombinase XerD